MSRLSDLDERIAATEEKLKSLKAEREAVREREKESLFGRWATHSEHGRGVIISVYPYEDNTVRFCHLDGDFECGSAYAYVYLADLTLDPTTLTTWQDFEGAPEGTLVQELGSNGQVYVNLEDMWVVAGNLGKRESYDMVPCRVLRWGYTW